MDDGLDVMAHEFGHYLFGGIHYAGVGYHGLMDGQGSGAMSSFERIKMGWITPTTVSTNLTNETISDALTTNDIYKIPISGTSYFLIDNHQRQNFYELSWKKYNGGPKVSPGIGVLISHCTSSSIDIESAFGRWNWKKSGSQYVFPFEVNTPNRTSGEDKLNLRRKSTTSGEQTHSDFLGSQSDFFTVDYNTVFSPWSNPSASPDTSNIAVEISEVSGVIKANFYVSNAVNAAPSKPQNLKILKGVYDPNLHKYLIKLSWDANAESDLSLYEVWRKIDSGSWSLIGTSSTNSYDDYDFFWGGIVDLYYKIRAKDTQNKYSVYSDEVSGTGIYAPKININTVSTSPNEFSLSQNYPNPFNPSTEIRYALKENAFVALKIFDVLGSEIAVLKNENQSAGDYAVHFDASKLPSGIYFYSITAGSFRQTKKMILLR